MSTNPHLHTDHLRHARLRLCNDWRDIRFAQTGTASDSGNQGSGGGNKPVLSFYFWIYLIISLVLTAITVFGWWRYTSEANLEPDIEPMSRVLPIPDFPEFKGDGKD